jgi:hypothetical protein
LFAILSIGFIAMDHLGGNKENQDLAQTDATAMSNNTNTGLSTSNSIKFKQSFQLTSRES